MLNMKLLWWLSGKESACNAGDSVGSLDLDDFLEEGMATHSVFLPGKSHGQRSLVGYSPSVQFSSVAQLCPTLCNPMNCSMPSLPVYHQLPEPTQTHVHWVGDAIQLSHPLSSPSPPALNLSQHQGLFQWIGSLNQVAKVLELQLQHQSFQWMFMTDFL